MICTFNESIQIEGSRAFIRIPFNVWEETGLKGNIPCRVTIEIYTFECKLIPKGNGNYLIPIPKKIMSHLSAEESYNVLFEPIRTLSRINHDSPYSVEHPIRRIDGIEAIPIQAGLCGHCCVAMLAGVPLDDVVALMGKAHASWSKILEAFAGWMPLGVGIRLLKSVSIGCYDNIVIPMVTLIAITVICGTVAVKTFRWE